MRSVFFAIGIVLGCASSAIAQDGNNVLVVINEASAESEQIAARYVAARRIPAVNVVRVRTIVDDEIDRLRFDAEIERPLATWITRHSAQDRILFIVLTKGIPLRVTGTGGLSGTVASVDSELTLLYRKMLGHGVAPGGRIANPYYHGDKALTSAAKFTHRLHDIYLVTRLDGFSVADVFQLIDRGIAPVKDGVFVLDQKANVLGDRTGDTWLAAVADRMAGFASRTVLESSPQLAAEKQVLGYYFWGSNDPAVKQRRPAVSFVPGALAAMFVSTDGRTFKEPPEKWTIGDWSDSRTYFRGSPQSLAGDLIRQGVTGVSGHVAEPYLDASARPQILFPAYVRGFNLAESFYLALPYLSWQTIVVGDPLCAPFRTEQLAAEDAAPSLDPETNLPHFFATRRLDVLIQNGARAEVGKLLLKSDWHLSRDDFDGARSLLEEVIAIDPTVSAPNAVLAGIYEQAGEYDKSVERYRAILSVRRDDVRALNNLAYLLAVRKGAPAEALPLAERGYKLARGKQMVQDLAFALAVRRGNESNAGPFSQDAVNLLTSHAQIADTLGWTHHLLGNHTDADRYLTEAVEGDPASAEIQIHVAFVKEALGARREARGALDAALTIDPSQADVDVVKALRARLVLQ